MNFENLELLREALLEISSECTSHTTCYNCPLQRTKDGITICGVIGEWIDNETEAKAPRRWNVISDVKLLQ